MKPIRVMIVDDEILAIEHIRRLVPWEELGYQIVSTSTQPMKALSIAKEVRPELVIADIQMPGMSGLELSRQIMKAGLAPTIILLTAYKEFEYAVEAVKLGVSSYWVKHELDADSLQIELSLLRKELERELLQQAAVRRHLFEECLSGRPLTQEEWDTALEHHPGAWRFHLIVLQSDRPFPLFHKMAADAARYPVVERWPDDSQDESLLAAFPAEFGRYVLLFAGDDARSERKQWELIEEKALNARQLFEEHIGGTASMAVAAGVLSRHDLPKYRHEAAQLLSLSVFFGPRYTFRIGAAGNDLSLARLVWEEEAASHARELKASQFDDARQALTRLFEHVPDSRDLAGFTDMCRQLLSLAESMRASCRLPSLTDLYDQGRLETARWVSWQGVRDWFLAEFESLCRTNGEHPAYSRKVRQALEFMRRHYADDISGDTIARQLDISADHLRHLFKEETGHTVLDMLTVIRMEHAKRMLGEGNFKVYEIAERVGFRSSQYFSQVFRKTTGMNPLEYTERFR